MSAEGEGRFTYVGLQIDQDAKYITISQNQDNDIKPVAIPDDVAMTDPLHKIQQSKVTCWQIKLGKYPQWTRYCI